MRYDTYSVSSAYTRTLKDKQPTWWKRSGHLHNIPVFHNMPYNILHHDPYLPYTLFEVKGDTLYYNTISSHYVSHPPFWFLVVDKKV